MKLNHDCVRDVLLFAENQLSYGHIINSADIEIGNYSHEDLTYTIDKLFEAGYLSGVISQSIERKILPTFHIESITWDGHQFLDNIRDDGVWKDTKKVLARFTSTSLGLIGNVATQVITQLIQDQL